MRDLELTDLELTDVEEVNAWIDLEGRGLEAEYAFVVGRAAKILAGVGDFQMVENLWQRPVERDPAWRTSGTRSLWEQEPRRPAELTVRPRPVGVPPPKVVRP